jgi:hypothetical protein
MAMVGPRLRLLGRDATGFILGRRVAAFGPAFALLAFAVGFALFPLRVVGTDFAHLPGDVVDNRLNNYVLEHGYRYLTGRVPEFWHAPFCYPARWMTARSDAHIGNLPIYSMFRAAGAGPERAFQLWWLATFGLNYAAAVWAARRLGVGWVGAAVGGYVFTFGLPVAASLPHAQLAPRYFVPPAVAFAWAGLSRPSWRALAGVAACVVGQTYCTVYIGYFLGLLLAAVAAAGVLCRGRTIPWSELCCPPRREFAARLAVVAVAVAALVPLVRPHHIAGKDSYPTSPDIIVQLTPKPHDWARPPAASVAWAGLGRVAAATSGESRVSFHLFPGGLATFGLLGGLGCGAAALLSPRFRSPAVLQAAGLAAAVMMVGMVILRADGWSPYEHLLGWPGVSAIRAPFRVVLVLLFPFGLLAGVAAEAVISFWERGRAVAAALALVAVAVDHHVRPPAKDDGGLGRYAIADVVARREALAAAVRGAGRPTAFYAFPGAYRCGVASLAVHVDAMWAGLDTGVPTVNGYTGHLPDDFFPFTDHVGVFHWLRVRGVLTPELLRGFVAFGEPFGSEGNSVERELRAAVPSQLMPDEIP